MFVCLKTLCNGLGATLRLPGQLPCYPSLVPRVLQQVPMGPVAHSALASNPVLSRGTHRTPSICDACLESADAKPCFDVQDLNIDYGNLCHSKLIRSFLYANHWPREPSVTGLWMALDTPYLQILTEKYAHDGDRILAFERHKRTGLNKLIGVLVANKTFPWVADELEEWGHFTYSRPDRHRMYFAAHCLRSPGLFQKYKVDYIYDIEVLCTAPEVMRQGVGTALLRRALRTAAELHHPLTQIICYSSYAERACASLGMQREWSMRYADYTDMHGNPVFYPRQPHSEVSVYTKKYSEADARGPCKPPW